MATTPRILAFAGSARRDSLNRKLLAVAVDLARTAGAFVTVVDLNEISLPLYHGDLEDAGGLPESALELVTLIQSHHALLIASPEYNGQLSPLLKNTIDWCSRPDENPFAGKIAAVVAASPGAFGGIRSALLARQLLSHLGCIVVPAQCTLPKAHEAFDAEGALLDARTKKSVHTLTTELIRLATRLA